MGIQGSRNEVAMRIAGFVVLKKGGGFLLKSPIAVPPINDMKTTWKFQ